MRKKNTYVVTPRCAAAAAAAAIVSAVVLRRPTKEYTHPYSMTHRRLPTAGIEVAPHYYQLLVNLFVRSTSYEVRGILLVLLLTAAVVVAAQTAAASAVVVGYRSSS